MGVGRFDVLKEALADFRKEIGDSGFRLAYAARLAFDGKRIVNLVHVHESGEFYLPLLVGMTEATADTRYAVISFAEDSRAVVTSRIWPQFDPGPFVLRFNHVRGSMGELVQSHQELLRTLGRKYRKIDPGNVRSLVQAYEEMTMQSYRSRGLVSEVYER